MRHVLFLFLVLLLAVCAAAAESAPGELLVNGGFEAWTPDGPVGWAAAGENTATTVVAPAAGAAVGAHAVRFGVKDPAAGPAVPDKGTVLRQGPVPGLVAGGAYELSFLARSDVADQLLKVIAYSDPHDGQHWYRITDLRLTAAWRRYSVPIRLPDAATFRPVAIHLWIATGSVEVDDASLHAAPPATGTAIAARTNWLDDPGFDLGGSAWRLFPWYQATDRLPEFDEQVKHGGRRSLHFPGQGESVESRLYAIPSAQPCTFSFWLRAPAASTADALACNVYLITAAWKLRPFAVKVAQLGSDWRRFSFSWSPPPDDSPYGASVYIRFDAMRELWLDSLQLEPGGTATAYESGPQIGLESILPDAVAQPGRTRVVLRARQPASGPCTATLAASDARDRELWSRPVDLGAVGPETVALPLDIELPRLGVTRLHAELRGADGVRLAQADLRLAVMDAAPMQPNPLIGIDNNPLMHIAARLRDRERWASLLGSGCTRVFFSCTNGTRKALDEAGPEYLAIARELLSPEMQQHRPVTTCIEPAADSPLNLGRMQRENHGPAAADEPAAIAAYAERAGRIATAMRGEIACYELLNEPNIWYVAGVPVLPADRLARIIAGVAPARSQRSPADLRCRSLPRSARFRASVRRYR